MALADNLLEQKIALTALLEAEYSDQNLRDQLLERLFYIRFLLGELAGSGDSSNVTIAAPIPTGTNSIGQVTANAGTNLNTSLLALETGGNLANIALATTDTTASGTITTQNLVPAGAATAGSAVSIDLDSKGTVTIQVTGTYTGALSAQITTDGTNWVTPANAVFKNMVTGANSVTIPSASVGIWQIEIIGHAKFRLSALATFTGTATIALRAAANTSQVSVAGGATAANQTTGNTSLASIDTKTPSLGQALAAASTPVVLPATQITALTPPTSVGITGTLPAFAATPTFNIGTAPSLTITNTAFTANAGTNLNTSALALESGGNLAGINTKLPASLGAKSPSASLSVTQAFAATSTLANVTSSATSVSLLAANNNRKTAIIINDSTSDLYVVLNASAASTTNYSLFLAAKVGNTPSFLAINGDDYSGEIRGIWSSANGFARITEVV